LAVGLAAGLAAVFATGLVTALAAGLAAVLATGLTTGLATVLAGAFLAVDTGEAFLGTGFAEDADGLAAVLALAGFVDFLAGMSILEQQKGVSACKKERSWDSGRGSKQVERAIIWCAVLAVNGGL
jgi:hypothetical protein